VGRNTPGRRYYDVHLSAIEGRVLLGGSPPDSAYAQLPGGGAATLQHKEAVVTRRRKLVLAGGRGVRRRRVG
jgi:hypothetical protein